MIEKIQSGDFIFPCSLGHLEICTCFPPSSFKLSLTNGELHFPQLALTDIPHFEHSYVVIFPLMLIIQDQDFTFQSVLNET